MMNNVSNSSMGNYPDCNFTDRDWIDLGKADAWAGKPKLPPEHDPRAASMYDLGYCEGEIERSPLKTRKS